MCLLVCAVLFGSRLYRIFGSDKPSDRIAPFVAIAILGAGVVIGLLRRKPPDKEEPRERRHRFSARRKRQVRDQVARDGIHPLGRNPVARERIADELPRTRGIRSRRQRIVDDDQVAVAIGCLREVAVPLPGGRPDQLAVARGRQRNIDDWPRPQKK